MFKVRILWATYVNVRDVDKVFVQILIFNFIASLMYTTPQIPLDLRAIWPVSRNRTPLPFYRLSASCIFKS